MTTVPAPLRLSPSLFTVAGTRLALPALLLQPLLSDGEIHASSNWDDGSPQGWTLTDNSGGIYEHVDTGGNPGGFIRFTDRSANANGGMTAPGAFSGNYAALSPAQPPQLVYDLRLLQPFIPGSFGPIITLSGPGGTARFTDQTVPTTDWTTRTVTIEQSLWTVTSGTWAGLMGNVTSLSVDADVLNGGTLPGQDSGLDNFQLQVFLVPEPGIVTLGLLGAGSLWFLRRKPSR